MEGKGFNFLDKTEERLWRAYREQGIKFQVSDKVWDLLKREWFCTPDMHHYDFTGGKWYDEFVYENMNEAHLSLEQPFIDCARYVENGAIPDLALGRGPRLSSGQGYGGDTLDRLTDLEREAQSLEKELAVMSDKITTFFYKAHAEVQQAQEVYCDLNVLSGLKCQSHVDVLTKIGQRFDEKLAALRFQLNENRVHSILNELDERYKAATETAKNLLEEIRKLA
jgi:hypothetical protein